MSAPDHLARLGVKLIDMGYTLTEAEAMLAPVEALVALAGKREANLVRCAHALGMLVDAFGMPEGRETDLRGRPLANDHRRRCIGRAMEEARAALSERDALALELCAKVWPAGYHEPTHCAECGEEWPCTVYTGRERYRADVWIGHASDGGAKALRLQGGAT